MQDQIVCPHCHKQIPLTQALSHQVQEKYQQFYKKRLAEETAKIAESTRKELEGKIQKEMELQIRDRQNESQELQEKNKKLQEQLLDTNKLVRQIKTEQEQKDLEFEKKLTEEQEKIREQVKRQTYEEHHLKDLEKDKKLQDALNMANEYKRKFEQGSQQTQGEVLEEELERVLKREFPFDEIKPVAKGVRGADIHQLIKNNRGVLCGSVVWEFKRTKSWSGDWIQKLKEDQRGLKSEFAVMVSQVLPSEIKRFGMKEGIWITDYESFLGLAVALRQHLIGISSLKQSIIGKNEKMEVLYEYLSGVEFTQRVEAINEAFSAFQEDIEKERRFFASKWAKQEKSIRKVIDNTLGMRGDLESIMGKSLGEMHGLEMLPSGEDEDIKKTEKLSEKSDTLF